MLWYKSWLETRWRFLIGIALLVCSAGASVLTWPQVQRLTPMLTSMAATQFHGAIGEKVREAAAFARTFRGYVWSNWFNQNCVHSVTLFAILLGVAGIVSESGGALFTLSLPVSRKRLLGVRAGAGLSELFVLAVAPSLVIPLLAPSVGESFPLASVLVYGVCTFVVASMFFMFALLLSTVFGDPWRPLLMAVGVAIAFGTVETIIRLQAPAFGVFRVMSGETWFRAGQLPWIGLLGCAAVSAIFYFVAASNLERRDF